MPQPCHRCPSRPKKRTAAASSLVAACRHLGVDPSCSQYAKQTFKVSGASERAASAKEMVDTLCMGYKTGEDTCFFTAL